MTSIPPVTIRCPGCHNKITVPVEVSSSTKVGNSSLVELVVGDIDHDCPAMSPDGEE